MKYLCAIFSLHLLLVGQAAAGNFSGNLADTEYNVAVICEYFDQDYFQFKSDQTDVTDTNGDGIVISGMQNNGKFVLTIIDGGTTYSTGNLSNFQKGDNAATGSGTLYEDGGTGTAEASFSVDCG